MKAEIKIRVLEIDQGDDTVHFQGFFSNELCSTTLEFYDYSNEFQNFASKLVEFPKTTNNGIGSSHHEVRFEIESERVSLNRLGNNLKAWNPLKEKLFEWRPNE